MVRRIGIYPGTFDPVHQGHLAFCLEVIKKGEVDEVVLLPERSPRGKPGATTISTRLDLLRQAIASFPSLQVVTLKSKQFTIRETLPELHELFKEAHLSLMIGSDIVPSLHSWQELDILLHDMPLLIGMRHKDTIAGVKSEMGQIGQTQNRLIRYSIIQTPHAEVASSHIRSGLMAVDLDRL